MKTELRIVVLLSLVAVGLLAAPKRWGQTLKQSTYDALEPGLQVSHSTRDTVSQWIENWQRPAGVDPRVEQLATEVRHWQEQSRRWQAEAAQLQEQLTLTQTQGVAPWPVASSEPLFVPEMISANVLSRESGSLWKSATLIDLGRSHGLIGDELVLADESTVIDQGTDAGLSVGRSVFAGRCVVGRLLEVGSSVSVVQLVTDEKYRGLARIVRRTTDGFVYGAEGILAGTGGETCILEHVPATEPVSVGDEIFSANPDETGGHPMYYGTIVEAELSADRQTWAIQIQPGFSPGSASQVTVLREKPNPLRTASAEQPKANR
ncbi:rod shape-determining protein MreC [Thalassoroseus pseudoceratinae]|uniref:rod shape-determining protein MreC n=1 Tax=Thalassoroseus pseudoceratinae TaxID=2713176 RepID=UPI00141E8143|nr:rod shape-determining protein MreC [Thalassoroseus pseudoceratinae]